MARHFSARTIKAITIPISVIVMFALISSVWNSLETLKTTNYLLGWTLAIAAVAAFIVSTRVETIEGEQEDARNVAEVQRRSESEEKIGTDGHAAL